jgi:hypothetical protein
VFVARNASPRRHVRPANPTFSRGTDRRTRLRRIATIAAMLTLVPAIVSYAQMLTQRSDSSVSIRTVEWLRGNGARGIVNQVEDWYYTLQAPSTGGPNLKRLPAQAGAVSSSGSHIRSRKSGSTALHRRIATPYLPPNIKPLIHPALPGEGVWHATFGGGGASPPVLITSYRPSPSYPQEVVGVAWINHTRTTTFLYPGVQEPSVEIPNRGPEEVPIDKRRKLVATFNSGFKLADSGGGFAVGGHTYARMKDGQATILRYTNGQMDVTDWTGGPDVPASVLDAQQNLPLIVDSGKPNPNLSDGPQWGATLGNAVQVYRSAVGIDRHGNLIYAAGNYQTVGSLAAIMIHAGAVRAMEMDINSYWPSFITYKGPDAARPANLLPDMTRSPYRYLTPDDRDFFAVYLR